MAASIGKLSAALVFGLVFVAHSAPADEMMLPPLTNFDAMVPTVTLPRFRVEPTAAAIEPDPGRTQEHRLKSIGAWLSFEFELPSIDGLPAVAFASGRRLAALRHRDVPSDRWEGEQSTVVAVYDDEAETIYLPEGWSGKTPGEISVLVHEMVHHFQNVAGMKFECPEAREKMAYEAQERWLALFGSDLMTEFGIDPFTVLVKTNCLY